MYCPNCGKQNDDSASVCSSCGEKLPQVQVTTSNDSNPTFWKTSVAATIVGIIVMVVFSFILNSIGNAASSNGVLGALCIVFAIYAIAILIYAFAFYLSLIGDRPRLTNNAAISFLNGFFGGIIFGCLWNYFLTKKGRRGSIITTVVYGIIALFLIAYYLTAAAVYLV